ncbi:MAG: ROK family transcriptional regulator [Blautia sp.]|nr:ROK family transcriptional regulator [Blautia sp.]
MGLNSIEVKRRNRNNVLMYMLKNGQVSKSSVASALKLSIPTVTQCLNELQEIGLVKEEGAMESIGGRKSAGYRGIRNAKVAIGVDITRNHVNAVVTDLSLDLLYSKRVNIRLHDDQESYDKLKEIIISSIEESGIDQSSVLGLGISLPAIIDETGTRLNALHEQMEISYYLYDIVKDWFPFPVHLENDANSAGRAEIKLSGSSKDTVFFFVSPSVGGAVMIDGKSVYGRVRRAGEFGHMTLVPGGRKCYCGRMGCMDAYCSTELLSECTDGNLREFFSQLSLENEECMAVWEEYLDYIALAIHNLIAAFDMEIIIGGYLGQYLGPYLNRLEARIRKLDPYLSDIKFIKTARLKYEASAIGAASIFIENYLSEI